MTQILPHDLETKLGTRAVHAGQVPEPLSGAVMTPIYQTSTYIQEGVGRHKGYEYARTDNPTRQALERNVAALEGATHGFAYGSGLAALDALLKVLKSGDHVVCGENMYGGSHRLMERIYTRFGLKFSFVDSRDIRNIEAALRPETRMIYCETPTNPMMQLTDLSAVGDLTQAHGYLFAVDNTFATPIFQRPLEVGADVVLHSTTKYLNGHSDMVGGLRLTRRDDLAEQFGFIQNASGAVPGPMDCFLALRGTKTLLLRMRQHDANGRVVAQWLSERKDVQRVYYPGLPSHPQHELARRQMSGFGGMVTIVFDRGFDAASRFMAATKLFSCAESLGGVESLVNHPAMMTHASIPREVRERIGIVDGLVRLSVGIEDADDLIADLEQALRVANAG